MKVQTEAPEHGKVRAQLQEVTAAADWRRFNQQLPFEQQHKAAETAGTG